MTKSLKVSFQQIQKYEKGLNGISSHMLFTLAKEQKWNIDLLFNGNPETMLASVPLKEQQRVAKKFFCFAKHHPGSARQKYTQPGKRNLADPCRADD